MLSKAVTVDLAAVFSGFKITSLVETTLTVNQGKGEEKKRGKEERRRREEKKRGKRGREKREKRETGVEGGKTRERSDRYSEG